MYQCYVCRIQMEQKRIVESVGRILCEKCEDSLRECIYCRNPLPGYCTRFCEECSRDLWRHGRTEKCEENFRRV